MRFKVIMLRKDRTSKRLSISPDRQFFRFKRGTYNIDREAVNLRASATIKGKPKIEEEAELIYVEGNPNPIGSKNNPSRLLGQKVIEAALTAAGEPKGIWGELLVEYMRRPTNFIIIAFAVMILIAALMQFGGYAP